MGTPSDKLPITFKINSIGYGWLWTNGMSGSCAEWDFRIGDWNSNHIEYDKTWIGANTQIRFQHHWLKDMDHRFLWRLGVKFSMTDFDDIAVYFNKGDDVWRTAGFICTGPDGVSFDKAVGPNACWAGTTMSKGNDMGLYEEKLGVFLSGDKVVKICGTSTSHERICKYVTVEDPFEDM